MNKDMNIAIGCFVVTKTTFVIDFDNNIYEEEEAWDFVNRNPAATDYIYGVTYEGEYYIGNAKTGRIARFD